jgi:hypothetical protein
MKVVKVKFIDIPVGSIVFYDDIGKYKAMILIKVTDNLCVKFKCDSISIESLSSAVFFLYDKDVIIMPDKRIITGY